MSCGVQVATLTARVEASERVVAEKEAEKRLAMQQSQHAVCLCRACSCRWMAADGGRVVVVGVGGLGGGCTSLLSPRRCCLSLARCHVTTPTLLLLFRGTMVTVSLCVLCRS
jgi:hypothetical protein